jgi:hypothetical protein
VITVEYNNNMMITVVTLSVFVGLSKKTIDA